MLEEVGVRRADRQNLGALPESHLERAAEGARHGADRTDIDDDTAVNLPEGLRIELRLDLLETTGQQILARRRKERGVFIVSPQVADLVRCDQLYLLSALHGDPLEKATAA